MHTSLRRPVETRWSRVLGVDPEGKQASFHAEKRGAVTEGRGQRWIGAGAAGRSVVPLDAPICVFDKALKAKFGDRSTRLRDTLFVATGFWGRRDSHKPRPGVARGSVFSARS